MTSFRDCICIAQARVIAGRKKEPHICTIAFHEPSDQFVRFCLPFVANQAPAVKRWHRFAFAGDKEDLGNDTRRETQRFGHIAKRHGPISDRDKVRLHSRILAHYKYEHELNQDRDSIGLLIPHRDFRFRQEHLSPHSAEDSKDLERREIMEAQGLWYPDFKIYVSGTRSVAGKSKHFKKQVLAWDVYEAIRSEKVNPFQAIYGYRNPYMIIGNLATQRNAFLVIGILSAPPGAIESRALTRQLAFA